jgi:tetratricopeptide (TPR) repeat protein
MILNNYGNREILAIQRCNLGLLYFEMMKDELAMDCFRKSSEILPEYFQNYIYMAKIKLRHNKIKEAKDIVEDKLKKYRSDPAVLELYSLVLLKDGQINASQYFAKKLLAKNADSLPALAIMAETCRIKNNYAGAISYWKSVRSLSPQNALSNLALIELYRKINYTEKLEQEIRLLFYLQGSLTLNEYIKKLTKDENLIIYVPKIDNYSFITRQFCHIN